MVVPLYWIAIGGEGVVALGDCAFFQCRWFVWVGR